MELVRTFLESSSIHGLSYIASTRKLSRVFWIVVVTVGFSIAVSLIYASFQSWTENPVMTTMETLPLSQMLLPKVTVCPPKNTFTDLNPELMLIENETLTHENREMLKKYAEDIINEHVFLDTFNKFKEENRYHNWYHGLTEIKFPKESTLQGIVSTVYTSATQGIVQTKYFGEVFTPYNIEKKVEYLIKVFPPIDAVFDKNVSFHFKLDKVSVPEDEAGWGFTDRYETSIGPINKMQSVVVQNLTPPGNKRFVKYTRAVPDKIDLAQSQMPEMPGFKFQWSFTGNVQKNAKYTKKDKTIEFVRLT